MELVKPFALRTGDKISIVFSKAGIKQIIEKFGIPQWNDTQYREGSHDYFIEAQLWNDKYTATYTRR